MKVRMMVGWQFRFTPPIVNPFILSDSRLHLIYNIFDCVGILRMTMAEYCGMIVGWHIVLLGNKFNQFAASQLRMIPGWQTSHLPRGGEFIHVFFFVVFSSSSPIILVLRMIWPVHRMIILKKPIILWLFTSLAEGLDSDCCGTLRPNNPQAWDFIPFLPWSWFVHIIFILWCIPGSRSISNYNNYNNWHATYL